MRFLLHSREEQASDDRQLVEKVSLACAVATGCCCACSKPDYQHFHTNNNNNNDNAFQGFEVFEVWSDDERAWYCGCSCRFRSGSDRQSTPYCYRWIRSFCKNSLRGGTSMRHSAATTTTVRTPRRSFVLGRTQCPGKQAIISLMHPIILGHSSS